jgi:penicillin-binding protein 1C
VDPLALLRAAYLNAKHRRVVSGGSTISMQVIRLARDGRPRTVGEKVVEMIWALRLELRASKEEILALYAAHAPFGGNVVGLEAAAQRYFGRSPDDLSWAEACVLAVLPNNPALVHPGRNRAELRAKRDGLLRRLRERGRISDVELRLALLEPMPIAPVELPQAAPHLLETLVARDTAGMHRYESTIDAALQSSVQDIVARHADVLSLRGIDNVAALVIDNQRFEVLAYVGNSRWSVAPGSGFAIDLIHRPRSTGSVLKPLLFARMLDAGEIVPQTLVPDLPTQYAGYMPKNFDGTYRGAVPARLALARSLNVPAVRMLRLHGVDRFYDFLRQMGMSTLHRQPAEYGLTLILGGAEGTLWDLSAMYANLAHIARGSDGRTPVHYRRPALLRGEVGATGGRAGVSVGAAWLTMEALVEVVRPGLEREWRSFRSSERIAWKTGTSYGRRDGWAIGSNPRYTVGVWAGNASGEGRPELTGVGAAAPVLFDIFSRLQDAVWFPMPEYALRRIEVCKNDGYLATGGCETELAWTPVDSHFERVSPHQQLVHLDGEGLWRVHGRCESVDNMRHENWFVLPPGQEYYYRRHQTSYRRLPPFRPDCTGYATEGTDQRGPMEFLYPNTGTRVYIPIDLDGRKGRVVFEVAHRDPDATIFWHLDDRFLGTTTSLHEQALDIAEGAHTVTVVDQQGNRLSRDFRVLDKRSGRADGRDE